MECRLRSLSEDKGSGPEEEAIVEDEEEEIDVEECEEREEE